MVCGWDLERSTWIPYPKFLLLLTKIATPFTCSAGPFM
ncbi:hypothetical protein AB0M44_48460 [Streptosporangium subroseum]